MRNAIFILLISAITIANLFSQQVRSQIEEKYKWDLSELYASNEEWYKAKKELQSEMEKVGSFKGKITQSAVNLLECLEYSSSIQKEAIRLYIYTTMNSDLDTRDMDYAGMKKEIMQVVSDFSAEAAYMEPEILMVEWEVIQKYIDEEPKLEVYIKRLKDLYREKEHTLSEPEEKILALSTMITDIPLSVYNTFKNAEMPNPEVKLSDGELVALTSAGYEKHRASKHREDRVMVFEAFWDNYSKYQGTYGEILYGKVKSELYKAKSRNYESTLQASLFPKNIPVDVYHSLVDNVNKNLPAFHRYLAIKKRMMQLDTLKYLDLYAPAVKGINLEYNFEEAKEIILEALQPLGVNYIEIVEKAFNERWIDVYPTRGKRAGAYSNGVFYDGHPFILLNYGGLYSHVSTTAHELGHTMHSYFSNKTQPFPISRYEVFVAEVASTFNEVLLFNYMINKVEDDDVKLSLLMDRLNGFKGTLFRQTQFAEFELKIHEAVQNGEALTGKKLSEIYFDIVKRYYGHDSGVCHIDDYIHMEWAFIPHFYYNFYVYQYSTSFTASNYLAKKVLSGEKEALDKYIAFLSSGGSDYPIELLRNAGVDMTSEDVFTETINAMVEVMDEIEKLLDKKGL